MPHAKVFKSDSGGHISIYVPWQPQPIEIQEGGTIETADRRTLDALKGSPEVSEVKPDRGKRGGKGA